MPRSTLQILFCIFIVFTLTGAGSAQTLNSVPPGKDSLSWFIDMKYGLDQELFNGLQYYKKYVKYKGDPFYPEDKFYTGSVTLKGITYEDLQLKYNCYTQQLILGYTDFKEQYNQLIINNIQVDSFSLGNYRFKNVALADHSLLLYQFMEAGAVTCYIHWKREIHATHDDLRYSHEYTVPIGSIYLGYRGELHPVDNRRTIIMIFPESIQADIKRYLRREHLRVSKAGPGEIQDLLSFIGKLTAPIPR